MNIYYSNNYKITEKKYESASSVFEDGIINSEQLLKEALRREKYIYDIERSIHGKPYLKNAPHIFFSVTHTKNLWLCAFDDRKIGIDAELYNRKKFAALKLAKRFFTDAEEKFIADISDVEYQRRVFLRMWTMKEAALKLKGTGISGRLDSIDLVYNDKLLQEYDDLRFYAVNIPDETDICVTVCIKGCDYSNSNTDCELPVIENIEIERL